MRTGGVKGSRLVNVFSESRKGEIGEGGVTVKRGPIPANRDRPGAGYPRMLKR